MTKRQHSLWFHYSLSAGIVLAALLTVAWYATDRFHGFFVHHLQDTLESRAITVNQAIAGLDGELNLSGACGILKDSDPSLRVTIVNVDGKVQCDSTADISTMGNHAHRPEISEALAGGRGTIIRFSDTLQTSMLYLAIPRIESKMIIGVIRTAIPLLSIDGLLDELYQQFMVLLVVLLGVVFVVIVNTYRKINQPFNEIIGQANNYAKGDFSHSLPNYEIKEISELGTALNRMAEQLDRLENLRQDFVANVSHELKTPIATIKGYVETLLDGAQHNPKDIERFLNIVLKQNNRLADIVDDLLTLSRLESAPITQILELNESDVCNLLLSSIDSCQSRADARNIEINMHCNQNLKVQADHSLMVQAIINLLDNAIKYSNENTVIDLHADIVDQRLLISVCDQGPGIPEEHIPRLFERFYRVDKSRNRRDGGTGLGLAIVKHIVHIHGGEVEIKNNGGAGCCFSIILAYDMK